MKRISFLLAVLILSIKLSGQISSNLDFHSNNSGLYQSASGFVGLDNENIYNEKYINKIKHTILLSDYIIKKPKSFSMFPLTNKTRPTSSDQIFIDFVGSGDIQKSITEGQAINANTGLGIIFERYASPNKVFQSFELEGVINIATTADTIVAKISNSILQNQRDFGAYVLNPVSAKQSIFINSNLYFGYPTVKTSSGSDSCCAKFSQISSIISGVNFRVVASNNVWSYNNINTDLGVFSLRIGVFHEFIPDNYRLSDEKRSKYSLFLGANYAYRGIFGDINSEKNKTLKENMLGKTKNSFGGVELNFGFRLNNIRAEFQMPMLKKNIDSINGLTNSQFIFSIKFIGGFPLKIQTSQPQSPS